MTALNHVDWMRRALAELGTVPPGDIPVAAIIVHEDKQIAAGVNRREADRSPLAHAEIVALEAAARVLGRWNLADCDLYVTLEPCIMCCGAILQARVRSVTFGAYDPKAGGASSLFTLLNDPRLPHRVELRGGILEMECAAPIREFFRLRR